MQQLASVVQLLVFLPSYWFCAAALIYFAMSGDEAQALFAVTGMLLSRYGAMRTPLPWNPR